MLNESFKFVKQKGVFEGGSPSRVRNTALIYNNLSDFVRAAFADCARMEEIDASKVLMQTVWSPINERCQEHPLNFKRATVCSRAALCNRTNIPPAP